MVITSRILLSTRKKYSRNFIDSLRLTIKGGSGGQGIAKYGGKGGAGGSVYCIGENNVTLKQLSQKYPSRRLAAENGKDSKISSLIGNKGSDIEVPVPLGVVVKNNNETVLGEINQIGDKVLVSAGGIGGTHSTEFKGLRGESKTVKLDLKLIADIGLVGFPNAGKSSILSAVSRATPKIATYPFTTIRPQLGMIIYNDTRKISMADLPGLIEGAHINVGMGHKFLKHVERTSLILFVVDIMGFRLGPKHEYRNAFETVLLLIKELELYKKELLSKPAILVLNKTDIEDHEENLTHVLQKLEHFKDSLKDLPPSLKPESSTFKFDDIITLSAKKSTNIDLLKDKLRSYLDEYAEKENNSDLTITEELDDRYKEHYKGNILL